MKKLIPFALLLCLAGCTYSISNQMNTGSGQESSDMKDDVAPQVSVPVKP